MMKYDEAGGFAVILFSTERQLLMKYLVILHACDFQALLFWTATDRDTLVCRTIRKQTLVHLVRMGQRFLQMFWFFYVENTVTSKTQLLKQRFS